MNNNYLLILTESEFNELRKVADHNHDCGLFAALTEVGSTIWNETIYEVDNQTAASIKVLSENDNTGFVINWNRPLGLKIHHFLASIEYREAA